MHDLFVSGLKVSVYLRIEGFCHHLELIWLEVSYDNFCKTDFENERLKIIST